MNIKKLILMPLLLGFVVSGTTSAGDEEYNEKGILLEISYLAQKLLDMSGKDSYTVEQPAYTKAFIGICTSIKEDGILLTCVTPGTQAAKSGLRTGDIITSINGVGMQGAEPKAPKPPKAPKAPEAPKAPKNLKSTYWDTIHNMKVGDVLKVSLIRDDQTLMLDVGVGELTHPKYTLTINK